MPKDEKYALSLCDAILGETSKRQHKFPFLTGDTGVKLPVDAYYEKLELVIEYREWQHSKPTPFFDRRLTVTMEHGVHVDRARQRAIYDQRRREILPQHGIRLLEVNYSDFDHNSKGKIKRHPENDTATLSRLLYEFCSAS
jgi:hypothetical protein